jgi:hypothetical protein
MKPAERYIHSDVAAARQRFYATGMWLLQLGTLLICAVLFYLADRYIIGCDKV